MHYGTGIGWGPWKRQTSFVGAVGAALLWKNAYGKNLPKRITKRFSACGGYGEYLQSVD